jgi:hypothetical protein
MDADFEEEIDRELGRNTRIAKTYHGKTEGENWRSQD